MIVFDNIVFSMQKSGGISVVWYELLQRILKDSRFDCRFLEYSGSQNNIFRKILEIPDAAQLPTGGTLPIALQSRILPHVKLKGKTLFHSSYYRILKDKKACNITTVHDFIYEKFYMAGVQRFLHIKQKSRAILNSQAIICISQNTRNDLLDFYPQIEPKRVFVVYNGVSDIFRVIPSNDAILPFPVGSYLLYVGARIGCKKFLPAVETLRNTGVNLIVVGGGDFSQTETALLDVCIGKGHYQHLKGISDRQLNVLYNCAIALLFPSSYEGFGIPIVEAQKAGCPVICQNTAIAREIAANGALFFSDFSEIPNLIEKAAAQKESLLPIGLKNASRFSWDKNYQEITAIYQQLIN